MPQSLTRLGLAALLVTACASSTGGPPIPSPTGGTTTPPAQGGSGGSAPDAAPAATGGSPAPDAAVDVVADAAPLSVDAAPLAPHKQLVKLNTTAAGANVMGDVANYPLAVSLDSTFDFTSAAEHGEDVRFFKMDGTPLPHAIEHWDRAGKTAVVWVRVDKVLGNNATQTLEMRWGDAAATDGSNTKAVFDATEFLGVYHLTEDGSTTPDGYKDASGREAHGTGVALTPGSRVPGRVGYATQLKNPKEGALGQWVKVDGEKAVAFNDGKRTISIWAKAASFPNRSNIGGYETVISKGDTSWTLQRFSTSQKWECCVRTPAYHSCAVSKTGTAVNAWFHFMIVLDQPNQTLYINGVKDSAVNDGNWQTGPQPLGIGNQTQAMNREWDGILDEARVMSGVRDANWAKLDYESQKEGQKLVTFVPATP